MTPQLRIPVAAGFMCSTEAALRSARVARVLIIDDEPAITRTFARILSGYEVVTTNNPIDALELLRAGSRFDAILSDINMPQMNGVDLHAAIHAIAPEQAKVIVFVSGALEAPNAVAFFQSHSNLGIDKPARFDELLAVVARVVAGRQ